MTVVIPLYRHVYGPVTRMHKHVHKYMHIYIHTAYVRKVLRLTL
jgi:hypothetical protein